MAAPEPLALPTERPDEPSSMVERFGRLQQYVARRLTEHVHIDPVAVSKVRERGARGTVVYVLRQRSLLDYLLINWLVVREGLPLARFANGVSSAWFLPVGQLLRRAFARLKAVGVVIDASQVIVKDIAKLRQIASDERSAVRGTLRPMH